MSENDPAKLKSKIKSELIDYFDRVKFEIDISAQENLALIQKEELGEKYEQDIISLNKKLIDKVDLIYNSNCIQIDDYFLKNNLAHILNDKEEIKQISLDDFCMFISNNDLKDKFKNKNCLGLFISCDWYLDRNQLNCLK
jgi:hypothetical protein